MVDKMVVVAASAADGAKTIVDDVLKPSHVFRTSLELNVGLLEAKTPVLVDEACGVTGTTGKGLVGVLD